jgi:hypothetical protein
VPHKANPVTDSATEPSREEMIAAIRRIISEDGPSVAQPESDGDEDILELTLEQLSGGESGAEEEILELTADAEEILELTAELGELPSQQDEPAKGLRISADSCDVTTKLQNSDHECQKPERVAKSFPANGTGLIDQHVRTPPAEMSPKLVSRSGAGAQAVPPAAGESARQSAHEKVSSPSEEATFSLEQAIATLRAKQGLAPLKPGDAKEKVPRPNLENKQLRPVRGEKD